MLFSFTTVVSMVLLSFSVASLTEARTTSHDSIIRMRKRAGQATFYAVGLGNCGGTNSDSEMVVAIAEPDVSGDTTSACGKSVSITNLDTNIVQTATVVDLCPGCSSGSLDMSPALFQALGGTEDQGVFPISYTMDGSSGGGSGSTGSTGSSTAGSSKGSSSNGGSSSGDSSEAGSSNGGSSNGGSSNGDSSNTGGSSMGDSSSSSSSDPSLDSSSSGSSESSNKSQKKKSKRPSKKPFHSSKSSSGSSC